MLDFVSVALTMTMTIDGGVWTDTDETAMIVFSERSSLVVSFHAFCFPVVVLTNKTRKSELGTNWGVGFIGIRGRC